MAIPQYPIAHVGSLVVISVNAFTASSYQNECRSATARSKSPWMAGAHETWKWTLPSLSPSWADATGVAHNIAVSAMRHSRVFMTWSSSCRTSAAPGRFIRSDRGQEPGALHTVAGLGLAARGSARPVHHGT